MGVVWEENGRGMGRYGKRTDLYGRGMGRERTRYGKVWEENGPLWAWYGKRTDEVWEGMGRERTSMGVLAAAMSAKPRMSEKKRVTDLYDSGATGSPSFSSWATDLDTTQSL